MPEISNFKELNELVVGARKFFHENSGQSQKEFEEVFFHCFEVFKSITKFYKPEAWRGIRQECVLGILIQSIETILAMYYLAESGFWQNSLVLKRNYVELISVAIVIGYDNQCYVEWKHNRDCFGDFTKISKRIRDSACIPDIEKELLPILKKYWCESSNLYSHNVSPQSIRAMAVSGQIAFEPKTVKVDFQQERLGALRNMLLNILSLILGIFDYGGIAESRKKEFPEALELIRKSNVFLNNEKWKRQELPKKDGDKDKKNNLTKQELVNILKEKGQNFDISDIPDDAIINSYEIDTRDPQDPKLKIESIEPLK